MLKDLSLNDCIISLESVLKLDYGEERTTMQLIKNATADLENAYGVTIDKGLYDIQAESQLSANNIEHLLNSISVALQKMALYTHIVYYTKKIPFTLADVNYLGFARDKLITHLKYLIDEDLYRQEHTAIMEAISQALDSISTSYTKRLFTIMIMLDSLGVWDGASVVAQLIFLGGIS